jgi:hypothetical protein
MTGDTIQEFPPRSGSWELDPGEQHYGSGSLTAPWDERLLSHIETHLTQEKAAASFYEALAEMGDRQVGYLARIVAADERRHHRMLVELLTSVGRIAAEEQCGSSFANTASDSPKLDALIKAVEELIRVEKSDAVDAKQLKRDIRSVPDGSLWLMIIEIMSLNAETHLRILKAIERNLKHRYLRRNGQAA